MADSYDVIVIGGGPGGYVAAIRAAQLGKKTAVVERDKAGGRCLNYACIPAKTVLRTAEIYEQAREGAELGVVAKDVSIDWEALGKRRASVSESLSSGVKMLWDKNKITLIEGEGSLTPEGNVKVGDEVYEAGAVVLATGSVALPIPGVEFGGRVVDTWGAWSLPEQPQKIAVAGAGASGCEIASAYGRFGTEVVLIEMLDQILPAEDKDMARVVERAFKKQNIDDLHRHAGERRRGRRELGQAQLRRGEDRGRLPLHRRRPRPRRRGPRARGRRGRADRQGQGQGRRVPAHFEPQGLRDRRPGQRQGARPQGLRGGRRRGRARRRRARPTRSTRTSSPARPSATPRSPASASPRRRRRRPGTTSRSASRSSAASAGPPSTTTKTAWSSSSSTPSTARSSAPTSSATAPAT